MTIFPKSNGMKPVYEWKCQRAHNKHFLVLLKDGKKIGSARDLHPPPNQCSCGPDYNCYGPTIAEWNEMYPLRFVAYVGGKLVGHYFDMIEAKIAVETELGVSTKKEKEASQPERVKPAHVVEQELRMDKHYGNRWREYKNPLERIKPPQRPVSRRTQRKRIEREQTQTAIQAFIQAANRDARMGITKGPNELQEAL